MRETTRRVPTTITLSVGGWEAAWRLSRELAELIPQELLEQLGRYGSRRVPWSLMIEAALETIGRSRSMRARIASSLARGLAARRPRELQKPRRKVAPRRATARPARKAAG